MPPSLRSQPPRHAATSSRVGNRSDPDQVQLRARLDEAHIRIARAHATAKRLEGAAAELALRVLAACQDLATVAEDERRAVAGIEQHAADQVERIFAAARSQVDELRAAASLAKEPQLGKKLSDEGADDP